MMNPLLDLSRKQGKEERIASRFSHLNIRQPKPATNDNQPPGTAHSSATSSTLPTSRLTHTTSSLPSSASSSSSALTASSSSHHSSASHAQSALQHSYAVLSAASLSALSAVDEFHRSRQATQHQQRASFTAAQHGRNALITAELNTSTTTNTTIQQQFTTLTQHTNTHNDSSSSSTTATQDPGQLYSEITEVYRQCLDVLQGKDSIIRELSVITKQQEESYITMLDEYENEVKQLTTLMTNTANNYKIQCDNQLTELTKNCQHERTTLISAQQNELEVLYDKRKKMELSRLDNKIVREKREEKELDLLRSRDLEDYYALKVELESSISTFETHLEDMRNMYNLNTEKLHYNHNILMERDHDNKATMDMYRTRVRKLKELVSNLSQKANEAEQKRMEENRNISMEYNKLTTKYKNLQKKLTAFLLNDNKNYDETRDMHITQVTALCIKLLHAEKIICEQVLGRPFQCWWNADTAATATATASDDSGGSGVGVVSHDEIQELTAQALVDAIQQCEERQRAAAGTITATAANGNGGMDGGNTAALGSTALIAASNAAGKLRYTGEQVQGVLDLLCAECHFLIPDTSAAHGSSVDSDVDGHLLSADALLHALGVEDEEDMDELVSLFYSSPADTTLNVDPNDVAAVIRTFVLHRSQSSSNTDATNTNTANNTSPTSPSHSAQHEKRQRRRDKEAAYWSTLARVNGDGVSEQWEELESWLVRYNGVLDERQRLLEDTGGLSRQNEELRNLLSQYQTAKINKELILPPIFPSRLGNTIPASKAGVV